MLLKPGSYVNGLEQEDNPTQLSKALVSAKLTIQPYRRAVHIYIAYMIAYVWTRCLPRLLVAPQPYVLVKALASLIPLKKKYVQA